MKKVKVIRNLVMSFAASAILVGCGESSSGGITSGTDVIVERGAVIGATVLDSSIPALPGTPTNNDNVYTFDGDVTYPITVTGGFVDVDGNGEISEGDTLLGGLTMKSYSNIVTPVSTYIASLIPSGTSASDIEDKVNEQLKVLADRLGDEVTVADLKKAPSEMNSKESIIAANAIYKGLLENSTLEQSTILADFEN